MNRIPSHVEPHSPTEIFLAWNTGEKFKVPYLELRFECPCAMCVDEKSGRRVIQKESIANTIKPNSVELVGRYALQINWNDRHSTGMYHFDRLFEICEKYGLKI